MKAIGAALLAIVLISASAPESAALPAELQSVVNAYLDELNAVEHSSKRTSLERVFMRARELNSVLLTAPAGGTSPLESLSDLEYEELEKVLRGMMLKRHETVWARPDAKFFMDLGERKGRTADRLVLRLYHRTYPNSVWAAYVDQKTDFSGCTDFGSGKLVTLYGEWRHYRSLHPKSYTAVVKSEMEKIASELTESTCACGNAGSVQSEFRYFLKRFPRDPIAPRVRTRLDAAKRGVGPIRFNCRPG